MAVRVRFVVAKESGNKRLNRLFHKQLGMCYFCRCKTVLPKDREVEVALSKKERRPALRAATQDHLFPRGHRLRSKHIVMACSRCNLKRGDPKYDIMID